MFFFVNILCWLRRRKITSNTVQGIGAFRHHPPDCCSECDLQGNMFIRDQFEAKYHPEVGVWGLIPWFRPPQLSSVVRWLRSLSWRQHSARVFSEKRILRRGGASEVITENSHSHCRTLFNCQQVQCSDINISSILVVV